MTSDMDAMPLTAKTNSCFLVFLHSTISKEHLFSLFYQSIMPLSQFIPTPNSGSTYYMFCHIITCEWPIRFSKVWYAGHAIRGYTKHSSWFPMMWWMLKALRYDDHLWWHYTFYCHLSGAKWTNYDHVNCMSCPSVMSIATSFYSLSPATCQWSCELFMLHSISDLATRHHVLYFFSHGNIRRKSNLLKKWITEKS